MIVIVIGELDNAPYVAYVAIHRRVDISDLRWPSLINHQLRRRKAFIYRPTITVLLYPTHFDMAVLEFHLYHVYTS